MKPCPCHFEIKPTEPVDPALVETFVERYKAEFQRLGFKLELAWLTDTEPKLEWVGIEHHSCADCEHANHSK